MISYGKLTKAEYSQITPVTDRIYYITDTGEQYLNGSPYSPDQPAIEKQLDSLDKNLSMCGEREPVCITALADNVVPAISLNMQAKYRGCFEVSTDKKTWIPKIVDATSTYATLGSNKVYYVELATMSNGEKLYVRGINPSMFPCSFGAGYSDGTTTDKNLVNLSGDMMSFIDGIGTPRMRNINGGAFQMVFNWYWKKPCYDFDGAYFKCDKIYPQSFQNWFYQSFPISHFPEFRANYVSANTNINVANLSAVQKYDFCILGGLENCGSFFGGWSSLNDLTVHFTQFPSGGITNWMQNVAATGTFRCPSALVIPERSANYVPDGWEIVRID